jgi:CRISPR type III-A-associated RAMP protein Csm5
MNTYEFRLRPLTPIAVLSGIEGIVGVDIFSRDREVCVVDFEKLPPEVSEKIASLRDISKISSVISEYIRLIPCKIIAVNNVGELAPGRTVKLPQEHIIPGSTLKGYIRTVLLYYILTSRHLSGDILRKLIDLMSEEPKEVAGGLENYAFRRERLREQGGYVDVFQSFIVSDPLTKESIKYSLELFNVFEVASLTSKTPRPLAQLLGIVLVEGLLKYKVTVMGMSSQIVAREPKASLLKEILNKLSEVLNIDLIKILKLFGCDLLNYELKIIRNFDILKDYNKLLEEFRIKYCTEISRCVIARLGFMTGHMAKTIDLYLKENHPDIYQDLKKYMSTKYRRTWDEATIKLIGPFTRLRGLGWCEICIEKLS